MIIKNTRNNLLLSCSLIKVTTLLLDAVVQVAVGVVADKTALKVADKTALKLKQLLIIEIYINS